MVIVKTALVAPKTIKLDFFYFERRLKTKYESNLFVYLFMDIFRYFLIRINKKM
jgi:hypothetical protein